ncbi:hypothetical protein RJ639_000116 [Escallonia herrerae]|uniref:Methyltransferase n=1 Tax=Escallonia herrerae TaxID=1293975 RepID=A0AA88XSE3_9ASTE|nr:hypothetical protein RJ639_000116 [Escallonia herrerae]
MKPISSDLVLTASTFIKLTTLSLLTLSLFFAAKHFSPSYPHPPSSTPPAAAAAISSRPPKLVVERTGIVDENGAMATDFVVGDYDPSKIESVVNASYEEGRESGNARVRVWKFGACDESKRDYVPCLDNVEAVLGLNSTGRGEEYERHCPARALDCLVPRPKGYKLRIPWPQSRDESLVLCEPFDTYPRTYDLLNAASLFSVEQRRCNISTIILEMDRILRPGGRVYISDTIPVIEEIQEIAKAIGWVTFKFDSGEGPHASLKLLNCEKRL